jgi:hypothetical protein
MPEKEQLIVYLQADSADLAILERLEFHQINSIVFLLEAGATVLFAILYWLLKKWIYSKNAYTALAD